ncbi:MAG TPA: hypothetical protein PLV25_06185, partial [Opitutales bacterium]|nr:hypothetical protein [Opitutales bacterium]
MRHLTTTLLTVLAFHLFLAARIWANTEFLPGQPELTADEPISFDQSTRSLVARGHAELADKRFKMEADEIRFEELEHRAVASGDVKINTPQIRLVSNQISYDMYTMDVSSQAYRGGTWPIFFEGQSLEGNPEKMIANQSVSYIAQPDWISPNIKAHKFTYLPDQKRIIVEHAWIRVGHIPVFYIPYLT